MAVGYMKRKLVFTLTHTQSHTYPDNILLTHKSFYQLIQTAPDIDILGFLSTFEGGGGGFLARVWNHRNYGNK